MAHLGLSISFTLLNAANSRLASIGHFHFSGHTAKKRTYDLHRCSCIVTTTLWQYSQLFFSAARGTDQQQTVERMASLSISCSTGVACQN